MNDNPRSNGITRRSFIKRSVVAAVAASSMTIFSGLVNAQTSTFGSSTTTTPNGYHCSKRTGVACIKPEGGPVDENGNAYWVCDCSGDSNKKGICDKGYQAHESYDYVWCE
jgi:anaerobic selenocysteine-containing dehydrogenase